MRPSALRHPVAVLRTLLGMNQPDFAKLVGSSPATIQSVELGPQRKGLSEEVALKIARATGASPDWLMTGDPSLPPVDINGQPYTKDTLRDYKTYLETWPQGSVDASIEFRFAEIVGKIWHAVTNAERTHDGGLVLFQISNALRPILKEHDALKLARDGTTPVPLFGAIRRLQRYMATCQMLERLGYSGEDDLLDGYLREIAKIDPRAVVRFQSEPPSPKPPQKEKATKTARRPSASQAPGKKRKAD